MRYSAFRHGWLLGVLAAVLSGSTSAFAAAAVRPNIILILGDDVAYRDLSCFGQKQFTTPNIDRLAAGGRVFRQAYAGACWCAPSRACLLTGRNTAHLNSLAKDAQGVPTKYSPTVAEMLRSAGYKTCMLGKWHMLEDNQDGSFKTNTPPAQLPWNRGFDVCRIPFSDQSMNFPHAFGTGNGQAIVVPENAGSDGGSAAAAASNGLKLRPGCYREDGLFQDLNGKTADQMVFAEEYYRKQARAFIRDNKSRPFFLYYASFLTHRPFITKSLREFAGKLEPWSANHKALAAMTRELDDSVGAILDELHKQGLEKNTLVMFASDNGYTAGYYFGHRIWEDDPLFRGKGPWLGGKHGNANGGVHVPFIAWGSMVQPGATDRAICFTDFVPTAAELAGTKPAFPVDGVSIVPLLQGREADQRLHPTMVWTGQSCWYALDGIADRWEPDPALDHKIQYRQINAALLDERWYVMGFEKKDAPPGPTIRVFDVVADPGCERDLSAKQPGIRARAAALFEEYP